MLISPYPDERRQFSEFRKAISAFVGGFVLAKIDPLLAAASTNVPGSTLLLGRVLLFGTTFLLCLQFTYVKTELLEEGSTRVASSKAQTELRNKCNEDCREDEYDQISHPADAIFRG